MKQSTKVNLQVTALFAGIALAGISVISIPSLLIQRQLETTTIEVVSKERLLKISGENNNSSHQNFVYTANEVYRVKDSFFNWHFRAATIYALIPETGGTCEVTLSGVRWGFLSMSKNIIAAKCGATP